MSDLGEAATDPNAQMLGGGNPGVIPEVQQVFEQHMRALLNRPNAFRQVVAAYDGPQGDHHFRDSIATLFRKKYDWPITSANISLTNGSQSAFFMLFNLLGGITDTFIQQILLPLTPEYIGYADTGVGPGLFHACQPSIKFLENGFFKYHIDFNKLKIPNRIGAICVSRPTNPTGNVLTDEEVDKLLALARTHQVPLIIDNAYGAPFPNIIFTSTSSIWNEDIILTMSLSKLGLPGIRTGIVIAKPEITEAISGMNAIINLATGGLGPAIAYPLIDTGEILTMSTDTIRPYYEQKLRKAVECVHHTMADLDVFIHKPEGTFFLWLWFRNLSIDSQLLYERLKARRVFVIAGHHFFPGLDGDWPHQNQCIRLNYAQDDSTVSAGLRIIADEVRKTLI